MSIRTWARFLLLPILAFGLMPASGDAEVAENNRERDRVLDRYIEAMGGRTRLNEIRSVTIEGSFILPDGREARLKVMKKRPNLVRTVVIFPGGVRMVSGYDGETAWQRTLTKTRDIINEIEVDEYHPFVRDAELESPLAAEGFEKDWISYAGITRIEGNIECHHLKVLYPNGTLVDHYLDTETFFERKTVKHEIVDDAVVPSTSFPSDFRYVDGVVFAYRVVTRDANGARSELTLDEVRVNAGLLNTVFEMPSTESRYGD